jgi:hypothetical protein
MEEAPVIISTQTLTRSALGTIACVAAAFALSGCANPGTMTPASGGLSRSAKPASASGFTFYTVDYPYESPNRITGIAGNRQIVGVYGNNSSSNTYHSYTSQYSSSQPYTQFVNDDYPNAPSTYMASIYVASGSSGSVQAGYVVTPGDLQGDWGVINNQGLWTLIRRHKGESNCHMMQLFGINSSDWAVGFYWYDDSPPSGNCSQHTQDVTELRPGELFHDFIILGANPVGTGITKAGWLVGSTDNSGTGPSQGWSKMVCKGCRKGTEVKYWNYNNDASLSTQLLGVNDSDVAVGTYQDVSGNWHGLIATNLFSISQQPTWQSVDEPSGNQTNTVISGIDDLGDICGWYTGTDGVTHGFVGIYQ